MTEKPGNPIDSHSPEAIASLDAGLVAFADCELIAINSAMMLVINRQNGNQQIMSPQVVEGLATCTRFDTLEAHAAHLAETRPELNGNQAMAATVLNNLKAAGMLLEAGKVCAKLAPSPALQLPPTRVFIITCDRPAAVERLLESLLRNGKLSQHNALFLIDDSRDQVNRDANIEAVARFNLRSAREMFYVGAEAQQTLESRLAESLPTHADGIRFLISPMLWDGKKTYGRSRNFCLLMSIGYRALIMDDDTLCEAILSPVTEPGIAISGAGNRKAAFYANEQQLLASGKPAGFDPLSGHAELLGSHLGQAIQAANNGPLTASQLQNVNAALANVLTADSPVLVTQCGTLGDPGAGTHWAASMNEDSVERLLAAPHGMKAALENRLSWLGSSQPSFSRVPLISQVTGLDNSQILPPYFPAFRGEDALFGAMLAAIQQNSVSLEYPWCVPHLPMDGRTFSLEESLTAGVLPIFVRYLTERVDYNNAVDPEGGLKYLGQDLLRMAARSDADLLLDYRLEVAKGLADRLYVLQGQFARAEKLPSTQWQDYIRQRLKEAESTLSVSQSPTGISGVPADATEAELLLQFRDMARGFAASLAGWVEIREVASGLVDELIESKKLLPH